MEEFPETQHEEEVREMFSEISRKLERIESKVETTDKRVQLMGASKLDDLFDTIEDDEKRNEINKTVRDIFDGTYDAKEIQ